KNTPNNTLPLVSYNFPTSIAAFSAQALSSSQQHYLPASNVTTTTTATASIHITSSSLSSSCHSQQRLIQSAPTTISGQLRASEPKKSRSKTRITQPCLSSLSSTS